MSKLNIKSLDMMKFTAMIPTREEKIAAAPAKKLPELKSYKANELAAALHPAVQHLVVAEVIDAAPDVKTFVLKADAEAGTKALAYFSAGQYLSLSLKIGESTITRPYSLSSSPKEALEGKYMLTIKRAGEGLASNYILDNWKVGEKVTASAPLGVFTYEPLRDAGTVIGLAGGSGITPFRSLAKAIADGDEDAKLILLYGSRTLEDTVFEAEFKELEKSCDKFKLVNVLSDAEAEGCEHGFITADLIKKYAPAGEDYSIFMCGPQAMYNFADKEIATLGIRRKFVRHELFGEYRNPEKDADFPKGKEGKYTLSVKMAGKEFTIPCTSEESLLVAMERAGITAPAQCRSGICGYCHSQLLKGDVYVPKSVDGRRLADLQFGYIHPCITFPVSDVSIDVPPARTV